jgi:hypothetical protein
MGVDRLRERVGGVHRRTSFTIAEADENNSSFVVATVTPVRRTRVETRLNAGPTL